MYKTVSLAIVDGTDACLFWHHNFLYYILQIARHLSPLETMAALVAAITHDLSHPGVNQTFLVKTSNHLVSLFKVIKAAIEMVNV